MTDTWQPTQQAASTSFPDYQAIFLALTDSQFVPYFQPIVTLRDGQWAGFEVLARWRHPTKGLIAPDKFIPLAERDGWIGALTHQILKKALAAAANLPGTFTISLNVSPPQLRDLTLPDQIRNTAAEPGFPLSRLVIEITESALIDDLEQTIQVVAELKAMGCRLALDDFGTGYSSLRHLQSLPFDKLKVDRSFVSSMLEKRESRKIVSAVVSLGQSLGLTTVAEGIETQEQAEMMIWLGCELGQGYFYGRPMPPEELAASIAEKRVALPQCSNSSIYAAFSKSNLQFSPSQRLTQLQAIYDGAPVGLGFVDQNLRFINLNKKLAEMNGRSVESHLGVPISETIPEMFPYVYPYLMRALAGEATLNTEIKHPSTGETRLINYQPAFDEAGEVVGVAVAVSNIEVNKTEPMPVAVDVQRRPVIESDAPASSIEGVGHLRPNGAKSSPGTTDSEALRLHEIVALSLVANHKQTECITLGEIAREMHKVGLVRAASLAINSLRRRKFIVNQIIPSAELSDAANATGLRITPSGQEWLAKHPQPVSASKLHIVPSTEPDSVIDLLSTLRFGS